MKIMMICNAGASSSLVAKKIKDYADSIGKKITSEAMSSEMAKNEIKKDKFDVILIGPQIKFMHSTFAKLTNKPVINMPPQMYGLMDGKGLYNLALDALKKK